MQLKRLTLTHFRVFEQTEFEFHPGMNLLVGVNGAGKSSVLDALRVMLSRSLPRFTASKSKSAAFEINDITAGRGALTAELQFEAAGIQFEHLMHRPREKYVADPQAKAGQVRDQTLDLIERNDLRPDERGILKHLKSSAEQPLVVYFSTHRSLFGSKRSAVSGQAAAFAAALLPNRGLRLLEFAHWWLAQEALSREVAMTPAAHYLNVLNAAVTSFLDDCTNLRAVSGPETTLLIDKPGATLDVRQLSDGERSIVALVLDLARRLAQANPKLKDPLTEGKAVVLIDELDLHLHPRWQRIIVEKLTRTFPNCQFIATTHSPQIVGEVSSDTITLIENGATYRPNQSLGMDSNWILRYLMGVEERDAETMQKLKEIESLIQDEQYDKGETAIKALRNKLGEFPELVRLQTRIDIIDFLSDEENQTNK